MGQAQSVVSGLDASVAEVNLPPISAAQEAELRSQMVAAVNAVPQDQFAVSNSWAPRGVTKFVVDLPSGQRVLVRHLDTMSLLEAGLLEEIDFFTKQLFPTDIDAQGNPIDKADGEDDPSLWVTLSDADKRFRFMKLLNGLLTTAVERPKVIDDGLELITDVNGKKRVYSGIELNEIDSTAHPLRPLGENETYASVIDITDKMAIFGELNKPLAMITPFREGSSVSVANVAASESAGNSAE